MLSPSSRKWVFLDLFLTLMGISAVLGMFLHTSLPYLPLSADLPVIHYQSGNLTRTGTFLIGTLAALVIGLLILLKRVSHGRKKIRLTEAFIEMDVVIAFWIFAFFVVGLLAPPIATVIATSFVCALSLSCAVFLTWRSVT